MIWSACALLMLVVESMILTCATAPGGTEKSGARRGMMDQSGCPTVLCRCETQQTQNRISSFHKVMVVGRRDDLSSPF